MLVWLASYPRSGNTLLRQVLKSCFDLNSCAGLEPSLAAERAGPDAFSAFYGAYFFAGDPEQFYLRARDGTDLVLVKTHQWPRDDEKAIYVVRDGRLALKSFAAYQDTYHPGSSTPHALLIGDHVYGDWTSHYRAWSQRRGETLVLRFEELVEADTTLLTRIAEFLGVTGPIRPWVNPQSELRARAPEFFGPGNRTWRPDEFWTPALLRAFHTLHGPLLVDLGYATPAEVASAAHPPGSAEESRVLRCADLTTRVRELQGVCDERLTEIEQLKRACDERLAEINFVTREAEARNELLTEAANECSRLRAVVTELESRIRGE
ncbi:Sulfotransferase family protein OS=Desulfovibrio vulgaris subsp. vulgaris (strain DP4) GN=Dvul_3034 PE=4 SV=1: Sulfotransfer_1 [Gemmata massiliana]|uniref:Sulfotransferase domain-containing protein n=1 Tax=Gemmata massiliana TaxID=1210884 RepID=A0A6P2CXS7_9BACT|nr:sulfotransferase domain-containing protein [Gemmata massiliana]VTR93948.1 Sulfotransferase family protein OS=Desulfovibrio vulgaris subsp. vulgaris (strain DP4) GN=Dvul_3034 PE=4 SV=1: Sulfotransfer_1 [Gemmata massiliana]